MKRFLELTLNALWEFVEQQSVRWNAHANRRTILVLLCGGLVLYGGYTALFEAPSDFPTGELVTIEDGSSLPAAAVQLRAAGVIRSSLAFTLTVKLLGGEYRVHAGDYLFKEPKNVLAIARATIAGAYGLDPFRFRIPEGATVRQMAALYATNLPRFDKEAFIEKATPFEGYLFPDTYFFLPNTTADKVFLTMRQNFDEHIAALQSRLLASGKSLTDIVIMASLLEREARNPEDRRMISGVLWNRIDRNMALQVDAAFLYTLGKSTFQLTMADLTSDSPYNTYKYKGLPPTPIGSPSLDSILAAAEPTSNKYLFYLADHSGVTHYSKTYAEHLRNKFKYLGT